MAKASDNPFPSVLVVEGTVPASPSAGDQRFYIDTADHKPKRVDSSGAVSVVGMFSAYLCYQDQKTVGTDGGTFTSGSWQTRNLNTEVADTANLGSVASNQVTLAAGTYQVRASAPAHFVNGHQTRVRNITASTTLATGTSEFASGSSGNPQSTSLLTGRFTLGVSSVLELQHQCQTTRTPDGLGVASGFGTEIFSMIEFYKEA